LNLHLLVLLGEPRVKRHCFFGDSSTRLEPWTLESHIPPIRPVVSMGQCNTGSKSTNTSFKSYIRPRALIQTENTVLFKFNRVQLGKITSLREVLSDQPVSWCCIDRLSWHRLSGRGRRRKPYCLYTNMVL
jgi:hypothetical protein